MRIKKKRPLLTIIVFLLTFSLISSVLLGTQATNVNSFQTQLKSTLTPHEYILISNDGNFSDYALPGSGTESDPYRIENYNITTGYSTGIYIYDTTNYFVIRNCFVNAGSVGIAIMDVGSGTGEISDVTCIDHDYWCIFIQASQITIKNCILKDNTVTGVSIKLDHSSEIIITNNTCINTMGGIYASNTNSCVISYNTFADNLGYGVVLNLDTNENVLHHNKFINNYQGTSLQAWDEGVNNLFYEASSEEGNYWDNWNDLDTPVTIGGSANNEDPYPLDENLTRGGGKASLFFLPVLIALVVVYKKRIKNTN